MREFFLCVGIVVRLWSTFFIVCAMLLSPYVLPRYPRYARSALARLLYMHSPEPILYFPFEHFCTGMCYLPQAATQQFSVYRERLFGGADASRCWALLVYFSASA